MLIVYTTCFLSFLIFLFKKDINLKIISLFYMSFIIFVNLSTFIFNKEFTSREVNSNEALVEITLILTYFTLIFLMVNINTNSINIIECSKLKMGSVQYLLLFPAIIYIANYAYNYGLRLDGSFILNREDRSSLDYYIYIYVTSVFAISTNSRGAKFLLLAFVLVYILSGERMKAYMYVITFLMLYSAIWVKNILSILILLIGFSLAQFMSILRSGEGSGLPINDVNLTHFGEVTVSSLYLYDYQTQFTFWQNINFSIGLLFGNILPSGFLPKYMDLKHFISSEVNIPGGGWLPVFFYSAAGYVGVISFAIILGLFYKILIEKLSSNKNGSSMHASLYVFFVVFSSTLPNWYMYTPYQIIKLPVYALIFTFILLNVTKLFCRKISINLNKN